MSIWGKTSLLISGFCLIVMAGAGFVLGSWHPLLYAFLILFLLGLIASVLLDYKMYLEFLSIKTAQKGLSLGWSLLILIVFLSAISYLGKRFNHSLDLTEEGINSLSKQTTQALDNLDTDLAFYVFYKGDKGSEQMLSLKQTLKINLDLYKQNSSKVQAIFIDTYKNNLKANEYLSNLPDKNQQEIFVFANYKDRKVRAEIPFSEESLTSAIIKAQKREFKKILFLTGHGEKDLNNEKPSGLKILNQSLKDSGFITEEWNFLQQQGPPPSSVELIISIGPQQPFLDAEKAWLKTYLSKGGHLLIALDPKEKHTLEAFLKSYGLIFKNDYILSRLGMLYGGATKALGVVFDNNNPITKIFTEKKQAVLFEQASSIDIVPSTLDQFKFSYLVRSHNQSFTAFKLTKNIKVGDLKSFIMAVEVSPKQDEGKKDKNKNFQLTLFGDSDFLTNRYIYEGANKDLALNAFISMAGEEELVSIRPKLPKGTKITLTRTQRTSLILFYVVVPLVFLLVGLWMWFRKREA